MDLQQDGQITKLYLEPTLLDDSEIDDNNRWNKLLPEVMCEGSIANNSTGVSAIVFDNHCLAHDLVAPSSWRYYQFTRKVISHAIGYDSRRLWLITEHEQLAAFDVQSGEWWSIKHKTPYKKLIHADKEGHILVLCSEMHAIDVLRRQDERLVRVTTIPISWQGINHEILDIVYSPEEDQFFTAEAYICSKTHKRVCVAQRLGWNGKTETVLQAEGNEVKLVLPFVVIFNERENELIYADLRISDVESTRFKLGSKLRWEQFYLSLRNVFAFDDRLFAVAKEGGFGRRTALILLGEAPEVLYEYERNEYFPLRINRLGRFLIFLDEHKPIYDLVAQREVRDVSLSALLGQAIQDEAERRKQAPNTISHLVVTRHAENSRLDVFKAFLHRSPVSIADAPVNNLFFYRSISSSRGDVVFQDFIYPCADNRSFFLLSHEMLIHYLMPEPRGGWIHATFDERGRAWTCNENSWYIAVFNPDRREARGFVLEPMSSSVRAIAAYADKLAIADDAGALTIYYYDGELLEKTFTWKSEEEIVWVIPEIRNGGWWLITRDLRRDTNVLKYLSPEMTVPETIKQLRHSIKILGDWPDQLYFVYTANRYHIHYTRDPTHAWHQISLQELFEEQQAGKKQKVPRFLPVSLHSADDEIFLLLLAADTHQSSLSKSKKGSLSTSLLLRLQLDKAQLVSALCTEGLAYLSRWDDWLILHNCGGANPFTPALAYVEKAEITDVPDNSGLLFYYPITGHLLARPYLPYSSQKALLKVMTKTAKALLETISGT